MPRKPILFISYSHLDEPESPREGEVRWLSFVAGICGRRRNTARSRSGSTG